MKPTLFLLPVALLLGRPARQAFAQANSSPTPQPLSTTVPGIVRDAGWWRLNGSLLAREPDAPAPVAEAVAGAVANQWAAATAGATFVSGLKRAPRPHAPIHSVIATGPRPLLWRACPLPPLREMAAAGYDFTALQARLTAWLRAAGSDRRDLLGFALPVGGAADAGPLPATVATTVTQLKTVLVAVAPEAALILDADATRSPGLAARDIDAVGAQCDAIVVGLDARTASVWPVKAARKIAEEQPLYDLPIFVRWTGQGTPREDVALADCVMSGATGLILPPDAPAPAWLPWVEGNLPLFVGSVTLEDIGLVPTPDSSPEADDLTLQIYEKLRAARRVPLVGRLVKSRGKPGEPVIIALGGTVSADTVANLRTTAALGLPLYIEGNPSQSAPSAPPSDFNRLVGASATAIAPRPATMSLDDPWTFGTSHGALLQVRQSANVTLTPGLDSHHPKPETGRDVLMGPLVVAGLGDGSPGIVVNPIGKGEVMWLAHTLLPDPPVARVFDAPAVVTSVAVAPKSSPAAAPPASPPAVVEPPRAESYFLPAPVSPETPPGPNGLRVDIDRSSPTQRYYLAVAGHLEPALVQVRGTDPALAGAEAIRLALRRSARGCVLLWLANTSNRPAVIAANVLGAFHTALDLGSGIDVAARVRGDLTEIDLTIPASGYRLIALAATRRLLDEERDPARPAPGTSPQ